jgi:protein TBF1
MFRQDFSRSSTILSIEELDIQDLETQETVQVANAATICSSLLEAMNVPLLEIHDNFLMTFLPESGTSPEDLLKLFLGLKTQVCVEGLAKEATEEARTTVLGRIFPSDMAEQLQQLHPDQPLSKAEVAFVEDAKSRRALLESEARVDNTRGNQSYQPRVLLRPADSTSKTPRTFPV